jgi:hypothetical protein
MTVRTIVAFAQPFAASRHVRSRAALPRPARGPEPADRRCAGRTRGAT